MLTDIQKAAIAAIVNAIVTFTNLVVSSVAGSGKTYVIEQFSKHDHTFLRRFRVCAIAFNKNAATELSARCSPALYTATIHAILFRLLAQTTREKIKVNAVHFHYAATITGVKETNDKAERKIRTFIAGKASDLSAKAKECLSEDYAALIERFKIKTVLGGVDYADQIANIAHDIVSTTLDRFYSTNSIDFVDMIYLPYVLGLMDRYDAAIVDEAQDLTPLKISAIQKCLSPKSLILVGDDNQCINIWAGAIPSFLANTEYPTVKLSYTHRNGINGCDYVQKRFGIDHFPANNVKTGDQVITVATLTECAHAMGQGLILSRTNADLVPTWHTLVKNGFTAKIVGNDNLPEQLINAINTLCDNSEYTEDDTDILLTAKSILESVGYNRNAALQMVSKMLGLTLCDKCGNVMVARQGKNGYQFFGCKGYPNCKNTMPKNKVDAAASFILSTVHKQKGATFANVALLPNLLTEPENVEEYNIRYVASTRQTDMLVLIQS